MTKERFAVIRELFHRAFDLPTSERHALLERECAGRDDLRTAVEELLRAEQTASGALDPEGGSIARQVLDAADSAVMPETIGPYHIQRLVGKGGMGEVYLAEQTTPQRQVAIKVLRRGSPSSGLHSRFAREVRALGRLEHPGIARIYEAGVAEYGGDRVPYFAMEYVQGPRLTDYAATMKLGVAERLELVAKIADAVQHAHTKGVIHRDLKPSNILVAHADRADAADPATGARSGTASGTRAGIHGPQPKILDFGVARVIEPNTQHTAVTEAGLLIGTVAYMSPEQLCGDAGAVDARTDVYSLGVILYELLTGRLPHDVRNKPIPEAARIVHEEDPSPFNGPDGTLVGAVDRDIQTIAARALAKDRERRYTTAAAFADDLRRYLAHEPILARPATAGYQMAKFARRHRGLVAGACAAALALAGGLMASTVLYAREQQARQRADEKERLSTAVQDYLVKGMLMAAAPDRMGHDVKMLDVLTQASVALEGRFDGAPDVEASIRVQLADVLMKVGKFGESEAQWERAIPLLERVFGPDDPRTISALVNQSSVFRLLGNRARSIEIATEALARARRSLPEDDPLILASLNQLGTTRMAAGRFKVALPLLLEGLGLALRNPEANASVIVSLQAAINECEQRRGLAESPVDAGRRLSQDAADTLGQESPAAINARSNLLLALVREGLADEAVAIASELPAAAERTFAPGHLMRGYVYRSSADSFRIAGRFEEAERYSLQAYDVFIHASPQLVAENDVCIDQLRAIYSRWPGHAEQLRVWGVRGVGNSLLRTPAARWSNVPRTLNDVETQFAAANIGVDKRACLDLVWQQRDELAPPGHSHRAMFFANFARMCAVLEHREHANEALALAAAALPDAGNPGMAANMIERAARP